MKNLLIIDALNLFIRNYVVNPSMDGSGNPIGGAIGFLKSLQKISRQFNPDEIMVVWDGHGGSQKRKTINKNYKEGRAPIRFNRRMIDLTPEEQDKNKQYQHLILMTYLNEMPVIQLTLDFVEADDIISFVSNMDFYSDWQKTIVSSDKDFFQLVDDKTHVYRPMQDVVVDLPYLLENFSIHPKNFALARAIVGDPSDNLPGVKRVGLKTIKKLFGFMSEDKVVEIKDLMEHCATQKKPLQGHKKIQESESLIKQNYKIMQLYRPEISPVGRQSIHYNVENFEPEFKKLDVVKMLFKDGLGHHKFDDLFTLFKNMER